MLPPGWGRGRNVPVGRSDLEPGRHLVEWVGRWHGSFFEHRWRGPVPDRSQDQQRSRIDWLVDRRPLSGEPSDQVGMPLVDSWLAGMRPVVESLVDSWPVDMRPVVESPVDMRPVDSWPVVESPVDSWLVGTLEVPSWSEQAL